MVEQNNLTFEEVKELIKDFNFEPRWGKILITLNQESEGDLITSNTMMSGIQYVVAAGDRTFGKPGDEIMLDPKHMVKQVQDPYDATQLIEQVNIQTVPIDGLIFGYIDDNAILGKYKVKNLDVEA